MALSYFVKGSSRDSHGIWPQGFLQDSFRFFSDSCGIFGDPCGIILHVEEILAGFPWNLNSRILLGYSQDSCGTEWDPCGILWSFYGTLVESFLRDPCGILAGSLDDSHQILVQSFWDSNAILKGSP